LDQLARRAVASIPSPGAAVDGADALILTTSEEAKKMTPNPVVIHIGCGGFFFNSQGAILKRR
jgi:hypothetical protein